MVEHDNDNDFETVVVDGEVWAVTTSSVAADGAPENMAEDGKSEAVDLPSESGLVETLPGTAADERSAAGEDAGEDEQNVTAADFDALESLTRLLVGGVIEGTSQLTSRLREYEAAIREEREADASAGTAAGGDEDELDRLRYALVGMMLDAQATFRRNVSLWAKLADQSARVTNRAARPVTNSFLFNPIRRRFDNLAARGEESLARWVADGRKHEPTSRELARQTYVEIVNEFIDQLAENPQLQAVITQQSIGVASDVRDEVRERTVTGDNLVEGLVRRLLRRTPRAQLPEPPPEVQRWAGLTLEQYRAQMVSDERTEDSS